MIYPWQQAVWQQLSSHWAQQPHAYLMHGRAGTGKYAFALHLAQALLCENPQSQHQPCGHCPACHLFAQHSHPDFLQLTPPQEEGSRRLPQITVDAVREALAFAYLSSHRGGKRIILIYPAENMNTQAANALLKVLEEPPQAVQFILVSHNKDRLLPTIKSRCRQLALPMPSRDQALSYLNEHQLGTADDLAFHGGSPLFQESEEEQQLRSQMLDILAQPALIACLDFAARYDQSKKPLALFLNWLEKWLLDTALAQQNLAPAYYPSRSESLQHLARRTRADALFRLLEKLHRLSPYGYHTLNVKMQTEDMLTAYLRFWQNKP